MMTSRDLSYQITAIFAWWARREKPTPVNAMAIYEYLLACCYWCCPPPGHWGGMEQVDREPGLVLCFGHLGFARHTWSPGLGCYFPVLRQGKRNKHKQGFEANNPKKE